MAAPNRVHVAGPIHMENTRPAFEAITPGHEIELYNDAGTLKWKKRTSATEQGRGIFALDQPEMNKGVDTDYAAGDLVKAGYCQNGTRIWALLPSGQNISLGGSVQSNGDGNLKAATADTAAANVYRYTSLDASGAVTTLTRLTVECVG